MKTKAQLKIQEMAFMLLAVVLFFILSGLFVLTIYYNNLHKKALEISEGKTLSSVTNLADSPEFFCVESKSNCVDGDKAISLINKADYRKFWSFSSLMIVKSRAFNKSYEEMIKCNFANYPDCDVIVIYEKKDKNVRNEEAISTFVALCRKEYEVSYTYDRCEIAKIVAGTSRDKKSGST